MTTGYNKPVPVPQVESDFYWEKCKQHELWLRYDNDAQQAYFYPRDISPITFSRNTTWVQASGKATLYTYAIVHRALRIPASSATSPSSPPWWSLRKGQSCRPTSSWTTPRPRSSR